MTPPDTVRIALIQAAVSGTKEETLENVCRQIETAAAGGAKIVCLQELFATPYFCQEESESAFELAEKIPGPTVERMAVEAKRHDLVLIAPVFEKCAPGVYFNSAAIIDSDGSLLGVYRKMHIPDDPQFYEKYYFSPGDTGFRTWKTRYGPIGVCICWDQWFPEAARCMALMGAEILLYPTAIGSEPGDDSVDSMQHWQNVMCGHAGANIMPLVASNRIGTEQATTSDMQMTFYGSSFIADPFGNRVETANRGEQAVLTHSFDLAEIRAYRETWGVYRDRRPDQYGALATLDGRVSG